MTISDNLKNILHVLSLDVYARALLLRLALIVLSGIHLASCEREDLANKENIATSARDRPTLIVSLRDDPTSEIVFKIDGLRFVVPPGYMNTILEGDPRFTDELLDGFTFMVTLPEFLPEGSLPRANVKDSVVVSLSRICGYSRSSTECLHTDVIRNYSERSWYVPLQKQDVAAEIEDLVPFGHNRVPASDPANPVIDEDLYEDPEGRPGARDSFLQCRRDGRRPVSSCKYYFIWKSKLLVEIEYRRQFAPAWREMREQVVDVLSEFVSAVPGESGLDTVYFPGGQGQ